VAGEFVLRFIDKPMFLEPPMWNGGVVVQILAHTRSTVFYENIIGLLRNWRRCRKREEESGKILD
jgi:hypothetical protein